MFNVKSIFSLTILFVVFGLGHASYAQSSGENDTYILDTLLLAPSEVEKIHLLSPEVQQTITSKPKTDGLKTYYFISGKKFCKGFSRNSKPIGEWISWYENGQIAKKITYKDGKRDGLYESWYENGSKNAIGKYKNDLREGLWIFYEEDGSETGRYTYKDGELVKK